MKTCSCLVQPTTLNQSTQWTPRRISHSGREHVVVRLLGDIHVLQEEYNQGPQMNRWEYLQTVQDVPMYVQLLLSLRINL